MKQLDIKIWNKRLKEFLPPFMEDIIKVTDLYHWTLDSDYKIVLWGRLSIQEYIWLNLNNLCDDEKIESLDYINYGEESVLLSFRGEKTSKEYFYKDLENNKTK